MNIIFYIIVFLEWFTTLSVEIMSIRNSISIIWSNSISTSIILGIILIALSYWYYKWWIIASNNSKQFIKLKIYKNLLSASLFYILLSFPFENTLLKFFLELNFWYFLSIFISILILFFIPVYLASQTIPLISELIENNKKAETIWKLLFFSTVGSFFGSIVTSLIFFPYIWVIDSIILNSVILSLLAIIILLLIKDKINKNIIYLNVFYCLILISFLAADFSQFFNTWNKVYSFNSSHNDINIYDNWEQRLFSMNWSHSSWIDLPSKKSYFLYIKEITSIIEKEKPKNILIIWAAWFSLPQEIAKLDFIDSIDVCDVDYSLKNITEKYFLKEKLNKKINFYPIPARYFLTKKINENIKYDFIFIDAYHWKISIPSQLLTNEFFNDLVQISKWIISMNIIFDTNWISNFYKNLSATISKNIPNSYIKNINKNNVSTNDNHIFINKKYDWYTKIKNIKWSKIYYDNKNSLDFDKYSLFY